MKMKVVLQPGTFALNYRAITLIFTLQTYKWKFFPHEEYSYITQQVGNKGREGYWPYETSSVCFFSQYAVSLGSATCVS